MQAHKTLQSYLDEAERRAGQARRSGDKEAFQFWDAEFDRIAKDLMVALMQQIPAEAAIASQTLTEKIQARDAEFTKQGKKKWRDMTDQERQDVIRREAELARPKRKLEEEDLDPSKRMKITESDMEKGLDAYNDTSGDFDVEDFFGKGYRRYHDKHHTYLRSKRSKKLDSLHKRRR